MFAKASKVYKIGVSRLYIDKKLSKNMEKKEEGKGKILVIAIGILVFLVVFHTYYNVVGFGSMTSSGISGKSIFGSDDEEENGEEGLSTKVRIIIASEWLLVILVMLYTLIKAKNKFKKEEKAESSIKNVSLKKGRNKTDIDLLYELLLMKKSLQISAIAKYFKVSKLIAMNWCQILEEGNLAEIHYPTVGNPKIELNEPKEDENEAKQKAQNNT